MSKDEMVTIPKRTYDHLQRCTEWLGYLEGAGVDDWDGMDYARELAEQAGYYDDKE